MADAARHNVYSVAEGAGPANYGTTPASPVFDTVRHTSLTLGLSKNTQISEELRSDRQIADFKHGARQVGGDLGFELSYGTFDAFLEALLGGTWTQVSPYVASTLSAIAADDSINDSNSGFLTAGIMPGDKIDVTGFTNAGNNTTVNVKSVTADKIIIAETGVLTDDAEGEIVTLTVTSSRLTAGVNRRSFSMLREFSDLDVGENPFHLFTGVEFNNMTLNVAADSKVTGTFTVLGHDQSAPSDTAPSGSSFNDANVLTTMDSFSGRVSEAGADSCLITELALTLENGLEPRFVVGKETTLHPTIGRSNLSANVTAFFENSDLILKFINEVESTLQLSLKDPDNNEYVITLPRIKYNGGQPDVSGQGAITLAMPMQALYDTATDTNMIITRIAGA